MDSNTLTTNIHLSTWKTDPFLFTYVKYLYKDIIWGELLILSLVSWAFSLGNLFSCINIEPQWTVCMKGESCLRRNGWIRSTVSSLGCWCRFNPNGLWMMFIAVWRLYCFLKKWSSVCTPSQIASHLDMPFFRGSCRDSLVWILLK